MTSIDEEDLYDNSCEMSGNLQDCLSQVNNSQGMTALGSTTEIFDEREGWPGVPMEVDVDNVEVGQEIEDEDSSWAEGERSEPNWPPSDWGFSPSCGGPDEEKEEDWNSDGSVEYLGETGGCQEGEHTLVYAVEHGDNNDEYDDDDEAVVPGTVDTIAGHDGGPVSPPAGLLQPGPDEEDEVEIEGSSECPPDHSNLPPPSMRMGWCLLPLSSRPLQVLNFWQLKEEEWSSRENELRILPLPGHQQQTSCLAAIKSG